MDELLEMGAKIRVFDPEAMDNVREIYGDRIHFTKGMYETLDGADCLAIMTEWNEFRTPDFDKIAAKLSQKVVFDGRNLYDGDQLKANGFHYESIGRPKVKGK
jgi:UDPglucose 6-dehydrogenase